MAFCFLPHQHTHTHTDRRKTVSKKNERKTLHKKKQTIDALPKKNKPYHEAKTLKLTKVGLTKLGLAKVGCVRMAEVGLAKVGFDRWCALAWWCVGVRGLVQGVWRMVRCGVCVCTAFDQTCGLL